MMEIDVCAQSVCSGKEFRVVGHSDGGNQSAKAGVVAGQDVSMFIHLPRECLPDLHAAVHKALGTPVEPMVTHYNVWVKVGDVIKYKNGGHYRAVVLSIDGDGDVDNYRCQCMVISELRKGTIVYLTINDLADMSRVDLC